MPDMGKHDDGRFFYWCWGRFQIVRFTKEMLQYSFEKWPDGNYEFWGIGWGPYYFGFFMAGVTKEIK